MAAAFRAGQHGGIEGLVAQQRGDLADGDSRRADEDVSIEAFPVFGKPLVEGPARQMHDVVSASGAAGADFHGQSQSGGDFPGADQAPCQ